MTREQFDAIMPYISSDLIDMIARKKGITEDEELIRLQSSKLYASLEQEDTKIWQYSTDMLYSLFEKEEKNGSIICRELLEGIETSSSPTPSERTEKYYKKRPCVDLVGDAAEIFEQYLEEKKQESVV